MLSRDGTRSPAGIKLATEAVAIQFPIRRCTRVTSQARTLTHAQWKKNPGRLLSARRSWRRAVHVPADSPGRAAGYGGIRLDALVDCCGRNLSFRSPSVAGRARLVVAISTIGAAFAVGTVLDALDWRIG